VRPAQAEKEKLDELSKGICKRGNREGNVKKKKDPEKALW